MSTPPLPQPSVTNDQFRADFSEFTDTVVYDDSSVTYWLTLGTAFVNPARWNEFTTLGIELFAAHNLVLETRNKSQAARGGLPGQPQGVLTSKSADGVSAGYDVSAVLAPDADHWNMTNFGIRYIHIARMAGAGAIQLGVGFAGPGFVPGTIVGPWVGPNPGPGWFS